MNDFQLRLFGTLQVTKNGQSVSGFKSRKALVLLGYLASTPYPVERSTLINLFWPEKSESRARNNLSQLLHNVQLIWPDCIVAERHAIRFDHSQWVDTATFETLIQSNQPASLAQAVALYTGDFMAGVYLDDCPELEQWLRLEQETWRQRVTQLLHEVIEYHIVRGNCDQALEHITRLLAIDPCQEEAHRQKMLLLVTTGQRSAALTHFETCRQILAAEMGIEPEPETITLFNQIKNGELDGHKGNGFKSAVGDRTEAVVFLPANPDASGHFSNLPVIATSFIGRETELAVVGKRLENPNCRLLTIIGVAGIGKTRLALQAVAQLRGFKHGVCFIPLTAVRSPDFIISTVADTLNFPLFGRGDPRTQLVNYLKDAELLLILDNFEHLLPGADILSDILQHAPGVKILVTSRERLNLQEEWVLDLVGLPYPKHKTESELEHYPSVQLFLQRAQQARVDFWLSYLDKKAIARICQLVEGMPLGIELAAAWTRTFSCKDIALEIEKSYNFLTTSLRNVPSRHRSLRAAFEHSWQLLPADERNIYQKLSVFWGGFDRTSAVEVVGASALQLSSLVDKSLLRWHEPDRYEFHELLRQYAAEKLDEDPAEKYRIKKNHCQYYAGFLEEQEARLRNGKQQAALAAISTEVDNIRAGFHWAARNSIADEFEEYCESLFLIHNMQNWFQEGRAVFSEAVISLRQTVARSSPVPWPLMRMLGKALVRQGVFCASLGQYETARAIMKEGLSIFAEPDMRQKSPLSLTYLGAIAWALGEYTQAWDLCQEALKITKVEDDRWKVALILQYLGMIAIGLGNYIQAKQLAEQCLSTYKEFGYRSGIAFSLNLYGIAARNLGEYDTARRVCAESLKISQEINDRWEEALALQYLGLIANSVGDYSEARRLAQKSLAIYEQFDYSSGIVSTLNLLAMAARNQGNYAEAQAIHGRVLEASQERDYPMGMALASYYLGRTALMSGEYEAAQRYLSDSLSIGQKLDYHRGVTQSLSGLGNVACAKGNYQEACDYFLEALEMTREINATPVTMDVLVGLAQLMEAEDDDTQALKLLMLTLDHPASKQETKDEAFSLLSKLGRQLPSRTVDEARRLAKIANLDEIISELLASRCEDRLQTVPALSG